ncbi:MAG TPA: sensor histidine kinase, partial [Rubricoccaceae bacterium]
ARVGLGREAVRFEQGAEAMGRWFDVYASPVGEPADRRFAVVFTDVSERKRAEAEVQSLNATLERRVAERTLQVRQLAARLAVAEQSERQRIAHVLHDDLQQQLYGLSMVLALLGRDASGPGVDALTERATRILDTAVGMARSLATELSPAILQSDRLADVLEWIAGEKETKYGLHVAVEAQDDARVLDPALRILLYQALRELLFNVVKHSGGLQARLVAWDDGEFTSVRVEDDGAGFDPRLTDGHRPGGFGLFSVRERIELVGGRFDVEASPGRGTRVTVAVPSGGAAPEKP